MMKIGIAGPISVKTLQYYLDDLRERDLKLGSGCSAINYLIIGLLKKGHTVSVYTLDESVKKGNPLILKGKKLTVFLGRFRNYKRFHQYKYLDFHNYESIQIKKFIQMNNPDIVNAHWSYEYAIGAIRSKFPHLITFRDDALTVLKILPKPYRLIRLIMDYWVRKNGKNFMVISPFLQNKLSNWRKDLPIIPNPFSPNVSFGVPKKISLKRVKIISILTGWGKTKNPEAAIKAFNILKKLIPNVHIEYHLYGNDYEADSNGHKWCIENNLCENIFFHGFLHHNDLMKKLEEFDILLHPAIIESFGNTLIEAMGKGLPVVAGKNSGAVPWVLGFGDYGILVDVRYPEDIAHGLKKIILDNSLYSNLSKSGIEYVKNNFSYENITNKYIELYEEIYVRAYKGI